jgi:hypothetical protein
MIVPDVNLLLYAYDANSRFHVLAVETDRGILLTPYAPETERALKIAARAVHVAPVRDLEHEHDQLGVVDVVEDAVVSNPKAEDAGRAGQGLHARRTRAKRCGPAPFGLEPSRDGASARSDALHADHVAQARHERRFRRLGDQVFDALQRIAN